MKIAYVKIRKDKDPVLQMLRQILPEDTVICADISTFVGSAFQRTKIGDAIRKDHPGLLIAYGEAAALLMDISIGIPTIVIDPIIDNNESLLDSCEESIRPFVVQTGTPSESMNADALLKTIKPIIEAMREDILNNEAMLENLIELAFVKTEESPKDFDGNDNITDNLRKHRDTVVLSQKACPDCGEHMIEFFVCSPPETWTRLCGRAGRLTYCPNCKTQHGFCLLFMN